MAAIDQHIQLLNQHLWFLPAPIDVIKALSEVDEMVDLGVIELLVDLRQSLLQQSWTNGLRAIVIPGVEARHWSRLLQLCHRYDGVSETPRLLPALGLHPCFIERHQTEHLNQLEQQLQQHNIVAVGDVQ